MRSFLLLFVLVLTFLSCSKEEISDPPTPSPEENEKAVNVRIEGGYNFEGLKMYSLIDSVEIRKNEFNIAVSGNETSYLIVADDDDILAVMDIDPSEEEVVLNSTNVAVTLLDILPSYQALTKENQKVVLEHLKTDSKFLNFVEKVDELLMVQAPIYSSEQSFLSLLIDINESINNLLEPVNTEKSSNKQFTHTIQDSQVGYWINVENKKIYNRRHSYLTVDINSKDGTVAIQELMEPEPFLLGDSSLDFDFQEDCYDVVLSQSTEEAKEMNYKKAADVFIGIIIGRILKAQGSGKQKCIAEIHTELSKTTASSLKSLILGTANSENFPFEVAVEATYKAFVAAFKEEECYTSFLNYKVISKLAAARMNAIASAIDAGLFLKDGVHLVSYLDGISYPTEHSEDVQLLQDRMIPGCVDITSNSSLNEEYAAGQEIEVSVKIEGSDFFQDYILEDFKVEWRIEEGNGELQSTSTLTDEEGVSTNSWFLPDNEGTFQISAVLKDNEDDLILSSPIVFTVNSNSQNGFYMDDTFYPLEKGLIDYDNNDQENSEVHGVEIEIASPNHTLGNHEGTSYIYSADYAMELYLLVDERGNLKEGTYKHYDRNKNDTENGPYVFGLGLVNDIQQGNWDAGTNSWSNGGYLYVTKIEETEYKIVLENIVLNNGQVINGQFEGDFEESSL